MAANLPGTYEDAVEITGTVTMARVDEPRLALLLEDGRQFEAAFRPEDEPVVLTALRERQRFRLRLQGRGSFSSDGELESLRQAEQVRLEPLPAPEGAGGHQKLWDRIDDVARSLPAETEHAALEQPASVSDGDEAIWQRMEARVRSLPPEVISRLPEDGADQHDHYVYGTRKRKL